MDTDSKRSQWNFAHIRVILCDRRTHAVRHPLPARMARRRQRAPTARRRTYGSSRSARGSAFTRPRSREPRGWFTQLARWYLARRCAKHGHGERPPAGRRLGERARAARHHDRVREERHLRRARPGSVSTGATVVTGADRGGARLRGRPGRRRRRSAARCSTARSCTSTSRATSPRSSASQYDPSHEEDLWRLYALAFGTSDHEDDGEAKATRARSSSARSPTSRARTSARRSVTSCSARAS